MTPDASNGPDPEPPGATQAAVQEAVADAHRREWAFVLAATVHTTRDLDLAEDCVQDAYADALNTWPTDGIPTNPAAWLTTTARRRAIDRLRRHQRLTTKLPLLIEPDNNHASVEDAAMNHLTRAPAATVIADERLRLVFLCCHPALNANAQAALTLRLVCGLSTADIAATFLVSEATMAARITRAKKKIAGARIPFRMPTGAELPDRIGPVSNTVYLLFTAGHTAPSGPDLTRSDVADTALRLARLLHHLMPDEAEIAGLLGLILVTHARRDTRTTAAGVPVTLADQDRTRWDRHALTEGHDLIVAALRHGAAGRYTLQAAIASLYAEPPTFADTDWTQILTLYDRLFDIWPSPVVALNRIVPLSYSHGPAAALHQLHQLEHDPRLADYHYLHVVKADLLDRLNRHDEATQHYRRARDLTHNTAEQQLLDHRISPDRS